MSLTSRLAILLTAFLLGRMPAATAAEPIQHVRLYALDCGSISVSALGMFSDTGDYDGESAELVVPCFVIRHPKGVLLWDAGLGDAIACAPAAQKPGSDSRVTISSQLAQLGLKPADITFMAFSHFHYDHIGNATQFPGATWILSTAELAAANASPPIFKLTEDFRKTLKAAKQELIDGDHDVFGDGTVRILKAPGHTPGHQVLALKLQKSGAVILSGDLYHLRESRRFRRVPDFNSDRADTLASFDRIETIVKNTHARFVVQHDPIDFKALPKFPAYLD